MHPIERVHGLGEPIPANAEVFMRYADPDPTLVHVFGRRRCIGSIVTRDAV
jgi:hypothetical protein